MVKASELRHTDNEKDMEEATQWWTNLTPQNEQQSPTTERP